MLHIYVLPFPFLSVSFRMQGLSSLISVRIFLFDLKHRNPLFWMLQLSVARASFVTTECTAGRREWWLSKSGYVLFRPMFPNQGSVEHLGGSAEIMELINTTFEIPTKILNICPLKKICEHVGQTFVQELNICAKREIPKCHTESKCFDFRCEVQFDSWVNFVLMWYFDIWKNNYMKQQSTEEVLQFPFLIMYTDLCSSAYKYIFWDYFRSNWVALPTINFLWSINISIRRGLSGYEKLFLLFLHGKKVGKDWFRPSISVSSLLEYVLKPCSRFHVNK